MLLLALLFQLLRLSPLELPFRFTRLPLAVTIYRFSTVRHRKLKLHNLLSNLFSLYFIRKQAVLLTDIFTKNQQEVHSLS